MSVDRDLSAATLGWSESAYLMCKHAPQRFIIAIGNPDDYSNEEIALLGRFGKERHDSHTAFFGQRLDWGTNFICVGKNLDQLSSGRIMWQRKRKSWDRAEWSPSLPEAIGKFWGDQYNRDATGDFVMLTSGEIAVIEGPSDRDFTAPTYYAFSARILATGEVRDISRGDPIIVGETLEDLADQMRLAIVHRIASASKPDILEVNASVAAISETNDPAALTHMWTARVWAFSEAATTVVKYRTLVTNHA